MMSDGQFLELPQTESTNSYLLAHSVGSDSGFTVFSTNQTSGRGRLGREWLSLPGESLAVSCLVHAPPHGVAATWLPLLAGVCAHLVVSDLGVKGLSVKWPNDLVVGEKKLAGILVEGTPDGRFVVGMGINLSSSKTTHPAPGALTLAEVGVKVTDLRQQIIEPWVQAMCDVWEQGSRSEPRALTKDWKALVEKRLGTIGSPVRIKKPSGEDVQGIATSLADDGGLSVALAGSTEVMVIHSGDVFHIPRS